MASLVFIFLDGVGLAASDPANPFWQAPMPGVRALVGGSLTADSARHAPGLVLKGLDATMGVPGLPQSGTGQTALFTGVNAARELGYHLPAYPNDRLVDILHGRSIFRQAVNAGLRPTFANAYTEGYFERVRREKGRFSATTHMVLGSGVPFRWLADWKRGQAVPWDITGEHMRERLGPEVPVNTPERAGSHLAELAVDYDLVLFECFLPDLIGHRKDLAAATRFLDTLDRFLSSAWRCLPPHSSILISSDHGNFEDLTTGAHTLNPAVLTVLGPAAPFFAQLSAITDVAGAVMCALATASS